MTITRLGLGNKTGVIVAGLLICLFGILAALRLPVQLTPDVERARIAISTSWPAAAPQEVESEIIEPQENVLRGLPGLYRMQASAGQGNGSISLELNSDASLDRTLLEVINRLNQVPSYPTDANEPRVSTGSNDMGSAIAWFAIRTTEDNSRSIRTYQSFVEDVVQPRIERVAGVAQTNAFGGRNYEIRVTFDARAAANLGIDVAALAAQLLGNDDTAAGFVDVGKRRYTLRYAGRFDYQQLGDKVLTWRDDDSPVYLRDIATVERVMSDPGSSLSQNGGPSIAMNVIPETGINVLDVMTGIQAAVTELSEGVLAREGLTIRQVYDESLYINDAIGMVTGNLLLGMALAIGILWVFLRKFRATLMVAVSIPICLLGSFIFLQFAGRTLNTISLAGLAFATGMVLDASIVVLENIVRRRELGEDSRTAAESGAAEVWGALIASTATTVAIFLPVVFLQDVAGQLFADLAMTISAAVVTSLVVAVSFVPAAADAGLRKARIRDGFARIWDSLSERIMRLTAAPGRRVAIIAVLILVPLLVVGFLRPQADYLPEGQRNLARAFIQAPPGMNIPTADAEIVGELNDRLAPYLAEDAELQIETYWLGVFGGGGFMGVRATDPGKLGELINVLNRSVLAGLPDTRGFASRAAIFGRFSGGRSIDIDFQGGDVDVLMDLARRAMMIVPQIMPDATARPVPGVELASPELRIVPNDRAIAEAGWTRRQLATVARAFGTGAFLDEIYEGNQKLNVWLRVQPWSTPEELAALPIFTPAAGVVPFGRLVDLVRTAGPDQIRRVDRQRTITLSVTPPSDLSLEEALTRLREEVEPALGDAVPAGTLISYSGQADDLSEALRSMAGSFALAVVILYLLMAALFHSFRDALLVIVTLPLATFGGVLALRVMNWFVFQPMDMLTMIGFIIVLGLVVNNAILLVYQARAGEREGASRRDAVHQALRLRLRPIFMTTLTSLFGMLPLLLIPGAGTELYRGMAAVIVGGMMTSTLFTLLLLPSILQFGKARPNQTQEEMPA